MKADNEPAISLPVYFKSVKKWKFILRKNKKKKKVPRRGKKGSIGESRTKDIFNTFAHDILPIDAIWSP